MECVFVSPPYDSKYTQISTPDYFVPFEMGIEFFPRKNIDNGRVISGT